MGKKGKDIRAEDQRVRIAIVSQDRCKPSKCQQECKKFCPVNAQGKNCVEVMKTSHAAAVSEGLCSGCGICTKKCPFQALRIVNVPGGLMQSLTHQHGPNGFRLHRLPLPRPGRVLGLLGDNGTGKSTALAILSGRLKPNLGNCAMPPDWKNILMHFRGSELQTFFLRCMDGHIKSVLKPQYVERLILSEGLPEQVLVADLLQRRDEKGNLAEIAEQLDISHLMQREVAQLSGGELQRVAIACTLVQQADLYLIDEPSAYLDIRQRVQAARVIRSGLQDASYLVVVEHDLTVLDYVSDQVCCLWGNPGAYGAVTTPFGAKEGINHFIAGFIPTENLRIRDEPLVFRVAAQLRDEASQRSQVHGYPSTSIALGRSGQHDFLFEVAGSSFASSEIVVLLGENGTGKTTLIKMLAGKLKLAECTRSDALIEDVKVSWKPQMFVPKFEGSVRELLLQKVEASFLDPQFQSEVVRALGVDRILALEVRSLSGGQLQRVALVLTLGKPADLYLIDEPSAYLDVEQRIAACRVIRRFMLNRQKTAFVVEHDFIMATYLADKVIVFEGQPGRSCRASGAMTLEAGMNKFLAQLGITISRDARSGRPRINKVGGTRDREQKQTGNYFFAEQS